MEFYILSDKEHPKVTDADAFYAELKHAQTVREELHLDNQRIFRVKVLPSGEKLITRIEEPKKRGRKKTDEKVYEQWHKVFSNPDITLAEAGKQMGVTAERARQVHVLLYGHGFKPRQEKRTEARTEVQKGLRRDVISSGTRGARIAAQRARKQGLTVSYDRSSRIIINGYVCMIRRGATVNQTSGRSHRLYYHVRGIHGEKVDFLLAILPSDTTYVIPASDLMQAQDLYIPLSNHPVYRNRPARLDYPQYKNAWWQLKAWDVRNT